MTGHDEILQIMSNIGDIRLGRFNDRMYLQKLGYLIQKIANQYTYDFSWYLRGPYSSGLASSLFLHEEKRTYEKPAKLSGSENEVKEKINELLGKNVNDPYSLELYASLWYLMSSSRVSTKEKDEILRIMCKEKPHFDRKNIESALEKISKFRIKYLL